MEDKSYLYERKSVYHERCDYEHGDDGLFGGNGTVCVLWKGDMRFIGVSRCHEKDQFNRKLGHKIAYNRALNRLEMHYGLKSNRLPEGDTKLYDYDHGCYAFDLTNPEDLFEGKLGLCCFDKFGDVVDEYEVPEFLYKDYDPQSSEVVKSQAW